LIDTRYITTNFAALFQSHSTSASCSYSTSKQLIDVGGKKSKDADRGKKLYSEGGKSSGNENFDLGNENFEFRKGVKTPTGEKKGN
jgi:hypothetical protein